MRQNPQQRTERSLCRCSGSVERVLTKNQGKQSVNMHRGPGQPVSLDQSGTSCGPAVKPQAVKNRLARRASCPIVAQGSERAARGNKQRPMASPDIFLSYNREDAAAGALIAYPSST